MLSILISALILCAALFLIARHEAEISLPVILLIAVGTSLVSALLSLVHPFLGLAGLLLALPWAIQRFCYVGWGKAFVTTGIYLVSGFLLNIGFRAISNA